MKTLGLAVLFLIGSIAFAQRPAVGGGSGGSGGGGTGTGNAANEVAVAFAATPTFTCGTATAGTATHFTVAALTGNITSSTLATCTPGQPIGFHFVQDGTGGRTVAMPTNWDSLTIDATASTATDVEYWYDGTNGRLTSVNGKATPFLLAQAPCRAAPTGSVSYPSNQMAWWCDSTSKAPTFGTNAGGTLYIAALIKSAATSHSWVTNIDATGAQNVSQPAFTDISGTASASQIPAVASVFNSGTITLPAGKSILVGCTSTCTVPVPVPVAGYQICIQNDAGVTTVITLAALGSSASYPLADHSGYGTAGTGTMVSTAAFNNVCLVGRDGTHYELAAINAAANWTVN